MIGIYDCFGYGTGYDVSFDERYKLIKRAGFDCVMLWWSDKFGRGECVDDCSKNNILTIVIHLPDDTYPLNNMGIERLRAIISEAESKEIQIAFENLRNINNLSLVLDSFHSRYVGYCYDSCHHKNYAPNDDLLKRFGNRLMALHLQDNGGKHNQHQLPFDGSIDWVEVMNGISLTGYKGATSLEPMNWDYECLSIQQFLSLAYQKAKELNNMRT